MSKKKAEKKKLKKKGRIPTKPQASSSLSSHSSVSRFSIVPVLLVTMILFMGVRNLDFVNWDDPEYVIENQYLELSAQNIKTAFLSGVHPDYPKGIASNYHPITIISLAVDKAIGDGRASTFHWNNLFFHLINTLLSYLLFFKLLQFRNNSKTQNSPGSIGILAAFGALIFAIHPMHVESVAWISERKDVLYLMFYLFGMLNYLRYKTDGSRLPLVYLFFLLSLLSKPAAVTFPFAILLIDYLKGDFSWKKSMILALPFFILSIVFGLITINIQADTAIGEFAQYSVVDRLCFASFGLVHYLQKFIFATPTTAIYPYPQSGTMPIWIAVSPFIILVLSALIWFFRKNRIVVFGVIFFVVNLMLTLQLVQVGASLVSDRYTYLPYHGLIVILLYGLYYLISSRPKLRLPICVILGLWAIFMVFSSTKQIKTWKDSGTLWNNVLQKYPGYHYALKGRGKYYYESGQMDKALQDLDKALEVYPDEAAIYTLRGNIFRDQKEYEKSLTSYSQAIELEPDIPTHYNNRANTYIRTGKSELAFKDYQKCLELEPKHKEALNNLGAYYHSKSDYELAFKSYSEALLAFPDLHTNYMNRSGVSISAGNYSLALSDINKYLEYKNPLPKGYYFKALALDELGKKPEALLALNEALKGDPRNSSYLQYQKELKSD